MSTTPVAWLVASNGQTSRITRDPDEGGRFRVWPPLPESAVLPLHFGPPDRLFVPIFEAFDDAERCGHELNRRIARASELIAEVQAVAQAPVVV